MKFSILRIRTLFNFAYKLILARLINVIFLQVFSLIIGKFYTAAQLGFYNRAKSFEELLTNNITGIIQRVSTPMLCDEQNDKHRLAQLLMKFIVSTSLLVYPMLFGLFVLAKPLVLVLLTEKWLPAVWMLQVLCPVGLLYVLSTFNLNVFNATGRTDWALKIEVVKKFVFVGVIVLAFSISFEALVISQIFIAMIELWINSYFTKKQINLTLIQQLSGVKGILFISGFMAACIFMVTILIQSDILKLLIGFITGIIVYSGLIYVFNINNFKETLRVIANKYRRSEY